MKKNIVKFPKGINIVMVKIPLSLYKRSNDPKICIRRGWSVNAKRIKVADLLLAVYCEEIVGVYKNIRPKDTKIPIKPNSKTMKKKIIVKDVSEAVKNQYKDKYIPEKYWCINGRYPIRYTYNIDKNGHPIPIK